MDQGTTSLKTYTKACRRASSNWTKELLHSRHTQEIEDAPVVVGPRNYFTQDIQKLADAPVVIGPRNCFTQDIYKNLQTRQ